MSGILIHLCANISYHQTPKKGLKEYHFVSDKNANIIETTLKNHFLTKGHTFTLKKTYKQKKVQTFLIELELALERHND